MNREWWKATGIRVLRTAVEVFTAQIVAFGTLDSIEWLPVLSATAIGCLEALLFCIKSLPEVVVIPVE